MTTRAGLYWRTLRHLRPIQVGGRIWSKVYRPTPRLGPAPATRNATGRWVMPARRMPSMIGEMTFSLLNETRHIASGPWIPDPPSHLWLYNVHYFDDLNAFDSESRTRWHLDAIARWIIHHRPAIGDAWAPYPTSLRAVNWIKWALGENELGSHALQSLATQLRMLRRRLEYHLLGNHLFVNAKALVIGGLFFQGEEAERWLDKGMALLEREIPEQILVDGGQFERSPMYHALALEDVLDLINAARALPEAIQPKWSSFTNSWPVLAERMIAWLNAMCHPDGEISLFNDAAVGVAPSPAELRRYATELGLSLGATGSHRLRLLRDSGYARAEVQDAVLLMDVAPIGPDYNPAHAHADTLSFEMSVFGQRIIVNGGTSRYGIGPQREAERATPAHSTVTIDGLDSSEVWAGFRVARRAKPFDLKTTESTDSVEVTCAHDGYRRLPGKPVHRRRWLLRPQVARIEDRIEGTFESAVARYHLHPAIASVIDGSSGALQLPGGKQVQLRASTAIRVTPSTYAPQFGHKLSTSCLELPLHGMAPTWIEFSW